MGYRASHRASTKHSPYFMLFQQHMRLPIDNEVLPEVENEQENVELDDLMTKLLKSREEAFNKAELNIGVAQNKQKETYICLLCLEKKFYSKTQKKSRERGESWRDCGSVHTPFTHTSEKVFTS